MKIKIWAGHVLEALCQTSRLLIATILRLSPFVAMYYIHINNVDMALKTLAVWAMTVTSVLTVVKPRRSKR